MVQTAPDLSDQNQVAKLSNPMLIHSIDKFIRTVPSQSSHFVNNKMTTSVHKSESSSEKSSVSLSIPVEEIFESPGNSEILNGDLENLKDQFGRSIRLKDNIYDKILHNINEQTLPLQNQSQLNPSFLKSNSLKLYHGPRSSINVTNHFPKMANLGKDQTYHDFQSHNNASFQPNIIDSGFGTSLISQPRKETKPSFMLNKQDMTINIDMDSMRVYEQPNLKVPSNFKKQDDVQTQISRMFKDKYNNFAVPEKKKIPVTEIKKRNKVKRSITSDIFVKLKIEKLENLFKLDFK